MIHGPDFRLDGRIALITGSGRGIGLGIARALVSAGCAVALQDIDLPVAQQEAQRMEQEGGRAIALGGDITDLSLPARAVQETVARLGGLHILVNNASIQAGKPWPEMSVEEMERQARADLLSPLVFSQAALPHLRQGGYGRIINIGSIQQKAGNPHMIVYSMSKAALVNLTTGLARSLAKEQITVNLIAPGWYNTLRNRDSFPDAEALKNAGRHVPIGRIGEPDDCGGAALLLCSPAGAYITGQSLFVDGGLSAT